MDGFGGDGGGFGDGGGLLGDVAGSDAGVGMAAGAGMIMAGGFMGGQRNMVPHTPGAALTAQAQRAALEKYRDMVREGLITEDDYDAVKSKVLGIESAEQ